MNYTTLDKALEEINESSNSTILVFSADWCGPCRAMTPVLEDIVKESDVNVFKVNIDSEHPDAISKYDIRSIPTLVFYKEGKEVNRTVGAQPKSKLLQLVA